MKSLFGMFIGLMVVLALPLQAQNFEGIITMRTSGEEDVNLTFTVKKNKVLMDVEGVNEMPMKLLSEKESQTMIAFVEKGDKKVALKMGPDMMKMMEEETASFKSDDNIELNITKTKKVIDGYNCFLVTGKDKESEVEAWLTKDLDFTIMDLFPSLSGFDTEGLGGVEAKVMKEGFLIEGTSKEISTGNVRKMKVLVEPGKVDDKIFNYTENDYKVYDLSNMMQTMMELQNDPEKMKEFQEIMELFNN